MKALELIDTAKFLVDARADADDRPLEADLRRAASTVYYALFHSLAECCANMLVGEDGDDTCPRAWNQAYRALDHRFARDTCANLGRFGQLHVDIRGFADQFVRMQERRHSADYDPDPPGFNESDILQDILNTEDAIRRFHHVCARERRAFAVYVLMKRRTR